MKKPLFTIITVCYNSDNTIANTIKSVLNQSFQNFEYIIIDGESKDNTVAIIESFSPKFEKKKISYHWISEKDAGIYDAFNKGLQLANGSWISFLGSDDIYLENALENYSKSVTDQVDFLYSNVKIIKNKKTLKVINDIYKWETFKKYMNIPHSGSFHNKDYFLKYGNFCTSYKIAGDYELLLRAKSNLSTKKVNAFTVKMNFDGISNKNIIAALTETKRAKIQTGKINKIIANKDFLIALIKNYLRQVKYAFIR